MSFWSYLNAERVGIILAVLAFVVGLIHIGEIRRVMREAKTQADQAKTHTNALEAHAKTLDQIERSLSTRLLGTFPDYYEDIVGLLGDAQERIVVFCDHPAYGSFSKRATWEFGYHHNLKRQLVKERRRLEITCLDEAGRRESVTQQFFEAGKNWETLKQEATEKLEELLRAHPKASKIPDLTQKEFEDILESEEVRTLEDLQGADIHEINAHMPLYFWLIDSGSARARAIFAIPSFSEKIVEYGFITTDQGLISAFEVMRNRYLRDL